MLKFACEHCDFTCKNGSLLKNHLRTDHESSSEFNCYECSFQGDSADHLKKHIQFSKHKIYEEPETNSTVLFCHTCGQKTDSKRNLMIHRKREHKDILRKCQFFMNNKCDHTDEECWFSHDSKTVNAGYSCSFCEDTFPNMA